MDSTATPSLVTDVASSEQVSPKIAAKPLPNARLRAQLRQSADVSANSASPSFLKKTFSVFTEKVAASAASQPNSAVVDNTFVGWVTDTRALSPDGNYLYKIRFGEGVSRIDLANTHDSTVLNSVLSPLYRGQVQVSKDGLTLYTLSDNSIYFIDSSTGAFTRDPVNYSFQPENFAVTPDGKELFALDAVGGSYSSATYPGTLVVTNLATNETVTLKTNNPVITPVEFANDDSNVYGFVMSPGGRNIYLSAINSDRQTFISVVDTKSLNTVVPWQKVAGITGPLTDISPDGTRLYGLNEPGVFDRPYLSVVDATTLKKISDRNALYPTMFAISSDGKSALFADGTIFNIFTGKFTQSTMSKITNPTNYLLDTNGDRYYVPSLQSAPVIPKPDHVFNDYLKPAFNALNSAPMNAGDLYLRLRDETDGAGLGIAVDKVQSTLGGTARYIVYLAGTDPSLPPGDNDPNLIANLPAYFRHVKQYQIDAIRAAIGDDTNAEIMLVGYSQGGLDAQNIAEQYDNQNGFNITTVVTYASPVIYNAPDPSQYRVIHMAAKFDPVPGFSDADNYDSNAKKGNIFLARSSNATYAYLLQDPTGFGLHGDRATYKSVGDKFQASPKFRLVRQNMAIFHGKISTYFGDANV